MSSQRSAICHQFNFTDTFKHENADSLNVWKVPGTEYYYVLSIAEWQGYNGRVVFIEPDDIIDITNPLFVNVVDMTKKGRVKSKKIRGIQSYGILLRLPESFEANVNDNLYETLKLGHYDPEEELENQSSKKGFGKLNFGENDTSPGGDFPHYDVEDGMKYVSKVFAPDELVWVTEKIHGANACYVFKNGRMNCRSRKHWKKEFPSKPEIDFEALRAEGMDERKIESIKLKVANWKPSKNTWWKVLDNTPELRAFCEANPDVAVYGEAYGNNKGFTYDTLGGEPNMKFRAFDILKDGRWMEPKEAYELLVKFNVPRVPVLELALPFNVEKLKEMCQGNSTLNEKHIREGIVVKPLKERWCKELGRVQVKIVNPDY